MDTTKTCEMCERFAGEMEDPTWDKRMTAAPLWICELCAKQNIEREMFRLQMEVIN